MVRTLKLAMILSVAAVTAQPALAQDGESYRVRAGLGAQIRPDYIGADSSEWAPHVEFSIKRAGEQFDFQAPDDSFDIKLIHSNGFSAGPVGNLQSGRKEKDVGADVGKIKTTIEAGAFAQYQINEAFRLRTEVRKGLGGHNGIIASLGGDYVFRDGDRYVVSVGPRVLWSNARFQREFFGVTNDVAFVTDLSPYRPSSGVHAIAATSGFNFALAGNVGVFGYGRYERLVGDAAKSPIVRELGSRNQMSAGLGLSYTFDIRR